MSYFNQLTTNFNQNDGTCDSFGRQRISSPNSLFDSQLTYDLQPLLFEQLTSGSGATVTHDTTNRMALFTLSSSPSGSYAGMQTYEHFRYTSGKSQVCFITFNMQGGTANVTKYAGYSDGTNGIEFQLNGTTPQVAILSNTSAGNQVVAQSSWNIDKMNGTGASGITLDFSKTQILVIDFQALYVGRVRIGFDVDGKVYYVHQFLNTNNLTTPYIASANLPIRVGMKSSATVSTTMNYVCSTVQTEDGGSTIGSYHFTKDGSVTAANGARTHLISLQPRLTFNSITNRTKILLESFCLVVTGNFPVMWELCLGDVLTGTTTFTDVNTTYSTAAYNTAGTTSGSPAIVIDSGHVVANNQSKGSTVFIIPIKYPITLDAAGAARALGRITVLVQGMGGASACTGNLIWSEVR